MNDRHLYLSMIVSSPRKNKMIDDEIYGEINVQDIKVAEGSRETIDRSF